MLDRHQTAYALCLGIVISTKVPEVISLDGLSVVIIQVESLFH